MDPTNAMEREVLVNELHNYQLRSHESSTVLAITYILATLLVVVIIMAFMQGRSFIAGCKRLARKVKRTTKKAAKTVKAKFDELTGQSSFRANENLSDVDFAAVAASKKCIAAANAVNGNCTSTGAPGDAYCAGQINKVKLSAACTPEQITALFGSNFKMPGSAFADTIQEFDDLLQNFYDDPTPSGFADLEDHFEDVKELFEDAVVEHFQWDGTDSSTNSIYKATPMPSAFADEEHFEDVMQTFDEIVQQSNFYAAAAANADSVKRAAAAANKAVVTAKKAVAVAATAPKAAGKAAVPAVVKTISNAKGAITDAKKTAAGLPKTAKVAPAPKKPVKTTRSTRIKSNNQISSVTTFPSGFPETVPDPNIVNYDQLDDDSYSSLIVNEVADARTIANHNEWVKEVGKQNTLPMDIMRDGFEISDYYHGRGTYMFSPARPRNFGLSPMQQEF